LCCTCKNRIKVAARSEKKTQKKTPLQKTGWSETLQQVDKKEVLVAYFKLDFTAFHKNNFAAYFTGCHIFGRKCWLKSIKSQF